MNKMAEKKECENQSVALASAIQKSDDSQTKARKSAFLNNNVSTMMKLLEAVCVEEDTEKVVFGGLGMTSYKLFAKTMAVRLEKRGNFGDKGFSLEKMAAFTLLHVLQVTLKKSGNHEKVLWHTSQETLQSKQKRGAGIVMIDEEAKKHVESVVSLLLEKTRDFREAHSWP